jgi:hypothetical protein
LAIGCWLLAVGYWRLAIGGWLVTIGYWLLPNSALCINATNWQLKSTQGIALRTMKYEYMRPERTTKK